MTEFSDLRALFINCTLKRLPAASHTDALMDVARAIMKKQGVSVDTVRLIDYEVATGVYPDMREHGWDKDAWPDIWNKVRHADILVVGTPIWLGAESSICRKLIERLYAMSGEQNEKGQFIFYGKTAGTIVTGNEDGIKHVGMSVLYSLQHIGYAIPPQADAGWIGEAGPGKSYADEGSGGPENEFTQRNTTFMTWNLMHLARILKQSGGFPAEGNSKKDWDCGNNYGHPNPEYR
ncbi:flavodoxin family protein [Hyphobacterium sp.]|uniref:flavodoxin family protein n=1 Tax=Hyphobacterium sp. TaxID=2004662 RepID=UPI003BAA9F43